MHIKANNNQHFINNDPWWTIAMQHFLTTFTVSPFHFGLTDFHPYYLINVIEYRTRNHKWTIQR